MKMQVANEARWEHKLGIDTGAADYEREDRNHSRYEPTSYAVLERLAASGYIGRDDVLVDYGCGKGRVSFFLNYVLGCRSIGVEYSVPVFECAQANLASYTGRGRSEGSVGFVCMSAEQYDACEANRFYFFNPFSAATLRGVLGRILDSYYHRPREMLLFFYYPLDGYLDCLMHQDLLDLVDEIDCRDLFHNDDARERIMVFKIDA